MTNSSSTCSLHHFRLRTSTRLTLHVFQWSVHALGSACRTVGLCRPGSHLRPGGKSETGKEEVPEEKKGRERKGGKREGRV